MPRHVLTFIDSSRQDSYLELRYKMWVSDVKIWKCVLQITHLQPGTVDTLDTSRRGPEDSFL
jgi:hypothetical protein